MRPQAHTGTDSVAVRTAEAKTLCFSLLLQYHDSLRVCNGTTGNFQGKTLEVMVKELKDSQSPEGDLLLRKPGRSVLQGISSLRAACPLLCARRAGNGSDRGPGDLCLNQTVQYVPTQAPLPPSSKQRKEP
ncbi:hypothetical protein QQF64_005602 [Cirrhinus molitorella]|uniref:Uncharacterized protein n=2 Tax=Cirrhinus molitorella TaxID=172907 RepID=A0AA88TXX5_9TELE|nr:hypothetical protein Q8A67_011302 [Cirrhinus molitorella]